MHAPPSFARPATACSARPPARPRGPVSAQRLQLGFALSLCFGLDMLMRPLHDGFKHHYSLRTLRNSAARTGCIVLRLAIVIGMALVWRAQLTPTGYVWLQASLAMSSCALAYVQHYKLSRSDLIDYSREKRKHGDGYQKRSSYGISALG